MNFTATNLCVSDWWYKKLCSYYCLIGDYFTGAGAIQDFFQGGTQHHALWPEKPLSKSIDFIGPGGGLAKFKFFSSTW